MDATTFDQTMTVFRRRVPFKPFTVTLMNGDRFEVDFPDALVVRDGRGAFLGPGGVLAVFDHESVTQVIDDLMGESSA